MVISAGVHTKVPGLRWLPSLQFAVLVAGVMLSTQGQTEAQKTQYAQRYSGDSVHVYVLVTPGCVTVTLASARLHCRRCV